MSETTKARTINRILSKLSGGRGQVRVEDAANAAYAAGYRQALEDAAKLLKERKIKVGWSVQQDLDGAAEIRALGERGL